MKANISGRREWSEVVKLRTRRKYQDKVEQTAAAVCLRSNGKDCLLQQRQPVATLVIVWAVIRATAAVNPRAKAGLLGYIQSDGGT